MLRKKMQTDNEEVKSDFNWKDQDSIIYGGNPQSSEKIASFDMDWTIIRTKSGKTFPQYKDDWLLWHPNVKTKIQKLYNDGFKIVLFTNQNGITKGHVTRNDICQKIENISQELEVPIQAFIATGDDNYKKPQTGMWDYFVKNLNDGKKVDMEVSFYCGDAAGRKVPKDFTDSDLKFALNLKLKFFTPDQLFLDKQEKIEVTGFNPNDVKETGDIIKEKNVKIKSDKQEIIVFCGSAGSGKSTFWNNNYSDYSRVNQDTLKTKEKCLKVAEEEIKKQKSVVIDNTNPSKEDRQLYINIAKKYNVGIRCVYFDIPKDLCFHLNNQRESNTVRQHHSKKISKIPIHSWYKNHVKPSVSEGFQEILTVNFVAGPFLNKEDKDAFYQFGASK